MLIKINGRKKNPKQKLNPHPCLKCLWQQMWLKGLPSYMYIRIIIVYMQNIKMTMRLSCYPSDYMHVLIHTYILCIYIYIYNLYLYLLYSVCCVEQHLIQLSASQSNHYFYRGYFHYCKFMILFLYNFFISIFHFFLINL